MGECRPRFEFNVGQSENRSETTLGEAAHRDSDGCVEFARTRLGIEPVLVASPSHRQSGEFVRRAAEMVARLRIPVRGDGDNDVSLASPNRSRIVGLPGIERPVSGFSAVSLLLIDEAARVDQSRYKALRPMLARGTGIYGYWWIPSFEADSSDPPYRHASASQESGFFYSAWEMVRRDSTG